MQPSTQRTHRAGRRRITPWVGIAALLAAATGCGGDDISKEDYLAQANAICDETNTAVDAAFDEFFATMFANSPEGPETPEDRATFIQGLNDIFDDIVTPELEAQLQALRDLDTPKGDGELLADLYDDLDAAFAEYNELLDDATSGDESAMDKVESGQGERAFDDLNERARDYGLTVCGEEDE